MEASWPGGKSVCIVCIKSVVFRATSYAEGYLYLLVFGTLNHYLTTVTEQNSDARWNERRVVTEEGTVPLQAHFLIYLDYLDLYTKLVFHQQNVVLLTGEDRDDVHAITLLLVLGCEMAKLIEMRGAS